jgi:phytoene dehydrogenase-like protein
MRVSHISASGWYDEFKKKSSELIIDILDSTIFKGFKKKVEGYMSSTPLTLERITGNSDGAITVWAFTNDPMSAVSKMTRIAKSIDTPLPDVLQAGQWSYSPSGFPISILTGKLAADSIKKKLKK